MKTCNICGLEKPRSEFHKKSAAKDGLQTSCKDCGKIKSSAWRKDNPERVAETNAAYLRNNPEKRRESVIGYCLRNPEKGREYRSANSERIVKRVTEWADNNPDKVMANKRKWAENNRERTRNKNREYREQFPEKASDSNRKWRIANPEKCREYVRNRRALRQFSEGKLSPGIVAELFARQNGRCVFCQVDLTAVTQHLDHIMPLALDGPNTDDNVQLLCARCNTRKGAKHPAEFARIIFEELCGTTSIASTCSSSADTSQRSRQSD